MINDDMRALIAAQKLCFAATVTPAGFPNLSPKGTIRVWDDHHLFFCDIASPGTRHNLESHPWIELNVVDTLSRRGYRFFGTATIRIDDDFYREATSRVFEEEGVEYPVEAVILIEVKRASPLLSPGYWHVEDEWELRRDWKAKRQQLEAEFEAHVKKLGPTLGRRG